MFLQKLKKKANEVNHSKKKKKQLHAYLFSE